MMGASFFVCLCSPLSYKRMYVCVRVRFVLYRLCFTFLF
jgi:hypothetical protein